MNDLENAARQLETARTTAQRNHAGVPPALAGLPRDQRAKIVNNTQQLLHLAQTRTENPEDAAAIAHEDNTSHRQLAEQIRNMAGRWA